MRLDQLWIGKFKNLSDITIDFDERNLTTVLIGRNATAKSNLFEALVLIFKGLDLGQAPPFRYVLKYICRERKIKIDADPNRAEKFQILVNNSSVSYKSFLDSSDRRYLPKNVFGYYSGSSKRLEYLFDEHQKRFYRALLRGKKPPLRPLFYARTVHSQYVLLSFFSFEEEESAQFLKDYLGIIGFEKATFVLKQPRWFNKRRAQNDIFWGAKGVVRGFLEDLYSLAVAPLRRTERIKLPMGRSKTEERLYLRIEDLSSLITLASKYDNNVEFFKTLESTYISDLIYELKIEFTKEGIEGTMKFHDLSEGEQQLLIVLGLLKFMKEEESLFLLDEPDTHLNPDWKFEYLDLLERVVGRSENSHVMIVTHDPLVIGGLRKEQVQIFTFKDEDKNIAIYPPDIDPIGLGVDGLLIEIFGLDTTLDMKTQNKLKRRQELVVRNEIFKDLRESEIQELNRLNDELLEMQFISSVRDPLYTRFLTELRKHELKDVIKFSELERKKQVELVKRIVAEIKDESK